MTSESLQDNWSSAASSSHYSPNLMRIETHSVTQCARALINFLHSTHGPRPSAEDCHFVFKVLTEWSIPAAHALVPDGSFDCKVMSARLALSTLCLSGNEIREAISSVIENWYRNPGQWKAAFESAVQIAVGTIVSMFSKLHCASTGKRKQLGECSCHPTSFIGSATLRDLLSGRSSVCSCVE